MSLYISLKHHANSNNKQITFHTKEKVAFHKDSHNLLTWNSAYENVIRTKLYNEAVQPLSP